MHDGQRVRAVLLVRLARERRPRGAEDDDVVPDQRVRLPLDAVVAAGPHHVALDHVLRAVAGGAVAQDAGVVGVVDDVVADGRPVAAVLQLDAIALAHVAGVGVVHVVALDEAIAEAAAVVVAAEVHPLAGAAGVVDVVSQDRDAQVVLAAVVHPQGDVGGVVDLAALDGHVGGGLEAEPGRAAAEGQPADDHVLDREIPDVLAGVAPPEVGRRPVGRADHDGLRFRATDRQPEASFEGVHPVRQDGLVARLEAVEDRLHVVAGPELDLGEGRRRAERQQRRE